MLQPLVKYFPLTFALLSAREKMLMDVEFLKNYSLPQDLRYFPMLVKASGLREEVVQTADYEFLCHWVKSSEEIPLKKQGKFRLNSTVQWIVLESAASNLGKEKGLYGLWKFQGQVQEKKLSADEASFISQMSEHPELVVNDDGEALIQGLKSVGILI